MMPVLQVALVDDERISREFISRMLIWHDGRFALSIVAEDAATLLEALGTVAVDVVLLDVSMPGMNGVELSGILAERYPQISILAISNFDDYDYVRQVMKNGAEDYLLKHRMDERTLSDHLERLLPIREKKGDSLRTQLRRFLSNDAPWPFPADGAQLVPCFGVLPALAGMPEEQREDVRRGVERILEADSSQTVRKCAVAFGDDRFMLALSFYDASGYALIERQTHFFCTVAIDSVHSVFHLPLTLENGPVMHERKALIEYIRRRAVDDALSSAKIRDTLTLDEQRRLLSLMEQGDMAGLEKMIPQLLDSVPGDAVRERLFLARALISTARRAGDEWGCGPELPADGNPLFAWMQARCPRKLTEDILEIYRGLLRERRSLLLAEHSPAVRDAARFVQEHYPDTISLSAVAANVGVNESYLSRLFKKEMGITVGEYLYRIRIRQAEEMLERGANLKEIAASTGFVQYTHFLRVFKQETGFTPKEYLQRNNNDG
jgi:two-component system, response regulator YesN